MDSGKIVWRSTDCLKLLIDWSSDAATNSDGHCHVGVGRGKEGDHQKMERSRMLLEERGCTWRFESSQGSRRTQKENQKDRHTRSEEIEEGVSDDESAGCELEQMTMKTDNEPSLGGVGG